MGRILFGERVINAKGVPMNRHTILKVRDYIRYGESLYRIRSITPVYGDQWEVDYFQILAVSESNQEHLIRGEVRLDSTGQPFPSTSNVTSIWRR